MALRVNSEVIPEQAILAELRRLIEFHLEHLPREEVGRQMPALLHQAREQALGAKLLLLEAERRGIDAEAKEIDAKVSLMISQCGGEDKFNILLRKQNLSLEALRASIRNGRRIDKFVAQIVAHVEEPSDAEVEGFYREHPQDFVTLEKAQVRHIMVKPGGKSEKQRAAGVARLKELKQKLDGGADFAALAAAHSDCPSGRKTGGSLGWLTAGVTLPEFDSVLRKLKVGEISEIFETKLGLHVIQKTAQEAGTQVEFEEVKDQVRDLLCHQARGKAIARVVAELKKRAKIEDDGPLAGPEFDAMLDSFLDAGKRA